MEKAIIIEAIRPLAAGGFIVVWKDPDSNQRHNTHTKDAQKWIEGYKQGKSLDELQKD